MPSHSSRPWLNLAACGAALCSGRCPRWLRRPLPGCRPRRRRPGDQVPAVDVVPSVDPLPRLLVLPQPGIQPPVDPGPVQIHQLRPVDPDPCHGGEALVQAHQHIEVRVRQQDSLSICEGRQRHGRAEEVLIEALPAGKVLDRPGRSNQQFVHDRTLPAAHFGQMNDGPQGGGGFTQEA
jgi:hypothetical protein